jgi:hypothetical protein
MYIMDDYYSSQRIPRTHLECMSRHYSKLNDAREPAVWNTVMIDLKDEYEVRIPPDKQVSVVPQIM